MNTIETMLKKHLEHLCVTIGARPVGSQANQDAANYIYQVFEKCGLEVEQQVFPCPRWEDKETLLMLGGTRLRAVANTFSPSCDLTRLPVMLGTIAELEAADLDDRIGVMYGELTKDHGLASRKGVYFPEHMQTIIRLLEEKHPAALITISPKADCVERLIRDWDISIPSATVPTEVGLSMLRQPNQPLHLTITSHRSPGHFANVIARKPGGRQARIVLLAHFDTMSDTPGAFDNGSGVAILLSLAELLSHKHCAIGLEWIAINGEEIGGVGDAVYFEQRAGELSHILSVINIDGAGQHTGANAITVMGASPAFENQIRRIHAQYPGIAWISPWYESDHSAFLFRGVPCIPLSSTGGADILHCPTDTVEWVSVTKLNELISLITAVVEALQDKTPDWSRN